MKPATAATLDLLREYPDGITALDALDTIGSFRLGARVFELREAGYTIDSEYVTTRSKKRIVRYVLREQPVQMAAGF